MTSSQRIQQYVEIISSATTLDDLFQIIQSYIHDAGFVQFTYHVIRPPHGPRTPFYLTSYPREWLARYVDQDYVNVDPIAPTAATTLAPFVWRNLQSGTQMSEANRRFFGEAGEFGLTDGVTFPLHGPGHCLATFNLAGCFDAKRFTNLWDAEKYNLHLVALYSHEAIVRHVLAAQDADSLRLSPRERECLVWTARGKTAWEVSEILSLSEETVTTYLKTAARKLGVHSKTHAVVKAIILGLIVP